MGFKRRGATQLAEFNRSKNQCALAIGAGEAERGMGIAPPFSDVACLWDMSNRSSHQAATLATRK